MSPWIPTLGDIVAMAPDDKTWLTIDFYWLNGDPGMIVGHHTADDKPDVVYLLHQWRKETVRTLTDLPRRGLQYCLRYDREEGMRVLNASNEINGFGVMYAWKNMGETKQPDAGDEPSRAIQLATSFHRCSIPLEEEDFWGWEVA